jgi:sporulation integral membrane protein YtvI
VVPVTFKSLLVWFISCFIAYLVLKDREKLNIFFKNTVSNSWKDDVKIINTQIIKAVMGFIKSQIIIIFALFIVSLICLVVVGSDYFVIVSILAGLFSIIPVIGTGIVYVPFIIIKFGVGDVNLAIKLIVVYIITIIVREILVVKVVSQNVGLDLLSTIISMYVGIEIFGGFGFIIGPLLLIIFIVIIKSSIMDKFRKKFNII